MLSYADRVRRHVPSRSSLEEELVRDAALYELAILGEGANRLSQEVRAAHPEVPWARIIALRNFLVHIYHRIDPGLGDFPPRAQGGHSGNLLKNGANLLLQTGQLLDRIPDEVTTGTSPTGPLTSPFSLLTWAWSIEAVGLRTTSTRSPSATRRT